MSTKYVMATVFSKLANLNPLEQKHFIIGVDGNVYNSIELLTHLVRLCPPALPMYWISSTAETKLKNWFVNMQTAAQKAGLKECPIIFLWNPWATYCSQLPPTDMSSATTNEINLWNKWFTFWNNLIKTAVMPLNISVYNDTECYLKASYAIPKATTEEQQNWDQNLLFRFMWADQVVRNNFGSNIKVYWYGLGAYQRQGVTKWRPCPNFPDAYTGFNKGPFNVPMYYMKHLDLGKETLTRSVDYAKSRGITNVSLNITFSGSVDLDYGRFTTAYSWPATDDLKMREITKKHNNDVCVWYASHPTANDTVNTSTSMQMLNNLTWWNHFIAYWNGDTTACTSIK